LSLNRRRRNAEKENIENTAEKHPHRKNMNIEKNNEGKSKE